MNNKIMLAGRYYHTLRHLRPSQVINRLKRKGQRYISGAINSNTQLSGGNNLEINHNYIYKCLSDIHNIESLDHEIKSQINKADDYNNGYFNFLNQTIIVEKNRFPWQDQSLSQLWRYQLHYFNWMLPLFIAYQLEANYKYSSYCKKAINSWVGFHGKEIKGDGWHPYTISTRLIWWLRALSVFGEDLSGDVLFTARFKFSILIQTRILQRDLEYDVGGNHLLRNACALIELGAATQHKDSNKWLELGLRILQKELSKQILQDGGHYERAPSYHLQVLQDIFEASLVLRNVGLQPPDWLLEKLKEMGNFLLDILDPVNEIPLLKDSTMDSDFRPVDLLHNLAIFFNNSRYKIDNNYSVYNALLFGAEGKNVLANLDTRVDKESKHLQDSGLIIVRDKNNAGDYLVMDVGKCCPDDLPAHAHADLLSFELTINNRKIISDSGVYEYKPGLWRDFFRSTRAHNTVVVDKSNQSDVWASFRVGRRAYPKKVACRIEDNYVLASASHSGYERKPYNTTHTRIMLYIPDRSWLFIDKLNGAGKIEAESMLHLHTNLTIERFDFAQWKLNGCSEPLYISAHSDECNLTCGNEQVPQGWYSDRFGYKSPRMSLGFPIGGSLPFISWFCISCDPNMTVAVDEFNQDRFLIRYKRNEYILNMNSSELELVIS